VTDPTAAVRSYMAAAAGPSEEALAALAPHLSEDASIVGPFAAGSGRDAVLNALTAQRAAMLAQATWSDPRAEGEATVVQARLPAGMRIAGIDSTIWLDASGRITRIIQEMVPAPAPPATDLVLTDDIKDAVDGALMNGTPVVVAYVDSDGAPHLSLRGSAQAYSDTQLALWIRDPEGGLLKAIATNPELALMYRDSAKGTTYQFAGRARADTDPGVVETVYTNTPELERNMDPFRRGVAVVIDLDRLEGVGPGGVVRMERA
jgi:pyridoxamine 5'-phosphate oxidase-like protein